MNDISTELGRRERKRLQQLDHLADTAWTLFEAEGYEAVTMERIAAEADVAKATLYKHFPVKEALLRHRFHRDLRDSVRDQFPVVAAEPIGAARLRKFFALSAAWSEQHRGWRAGNGAWAKKWSAGTWATPFAPTTWCSRRSDVAWPRSR